MGYWKSKVMPKIKKIFEKNGKKAAAAEVSKSFDQSKDEYNKLFEENKSELQPKVVEIYEASSTQIQALVKERQEDGLKKHSAEVQKFFGELVKIEFPGSKVVQEASSKFGAASIPGPVFFVFEKVSTFIVKEEKKEEEVAAVASAAETSVEEKGREIVVKEEKKEVAVAAEKAAEPAEAPVTEPAPAPAEPPKAEEAATPPPAAAEAPKP